MSAKAILCTRLFSRAAPGCQSLQSDTWSIIWVSVCRLRDQGQNDINCQFEGIHRKIQSNVRSNLLHFLDSKVVRLLLSASPRTGAVCWAWASTFFFTIYMNYVLLHDTFTQCNDKAMFRSVSNYILDTNTMIGSYPPPVRRQQRNLSTAEIFSI